MESKISVWSKIGFGFGHVYNDLCATVWFSYLLLFLKSVMNMPKTEAGALMMFGQISDAVATPIVGILIDKYGTKVKWHVVGTEKSINQSITLLLTAITAYIQVTFS